MVKKDPKQSLQVEELSIENENLAVLSWQAGLPCPDPRMMKNLGQMVAKALYSHKTQRQQEQLLLMEERSNYCQGNCMTRWRSAVFLTKFN